MDKKIVIGILFIIVLFIFFNKNMKKDTTIQDQIQPSKVVALPTSVPTPPMIIDKQKKYSAMIKTDKGDIEVRLSTEETPLTVNNFVYLARKGFYDGIIFHRVIKDFMIQTGDPAGNGTGGPGYTFEDEITKDQIFDKAGILAMANSGPNTNGSQFFITHSETPWLNGHHTIFGEVVNGMDVVESIATAKTSQNDKPTEDIKIKTITIIEE